MNFQKGTTSDFYVLRLASGEDILKTLEDFVTQADIRNGTILSGVGSVSRSHCHVVKSINLPPGNTFTERELPADILNVNGAILDGRVHAHISLADKDVAYGGHLEEGTVVLTFALITIAATNGIELRDADRYRSGYAVPQ